MPSVWLGVFDEPDQNKFPHSHMCFLPHEVHFFGVLSECNQMTRRAEHTPVISKDQLVTMIFVLFAEREQMGSIGRKMSHQMQI